MHLVLFSGGIDSTVLLYDLVNRFGRKDVRYITANTGQRQSYRECERANLIAFGLGLQGKQIDLKFIPTAIKDVVPGRNLILLSIAASNAQSYGFKNIYIGCNSDDSKTYPDCRIEFLETARDTIKMAYGVDLHFPLADKSKMDVVDIGKSLGVDFSKTYSCYTGSKDHCGSCAACKLRNSALGGSSC